MRRLRIYSIILIGTSIVMLASGEKQCYPYMGRFVEMDTTIMNIGLIKFDIDSCRYIVISSGHRDDDFWVENAYGSEFVTSGVTRNGYKFRMYEFQQGSGGLTAVIYTHVDSFVVDFGHFSVSDTSEAFTILDDINVAGIEKLWFSH